MKIRLLLALIATLGLASPHQVLAQAQNTPDEGSLGGFESGVFQVYSWDEQEINNSSACSTVVQTDRLHFLYASIGLRSSIELSDLREQFDYNRKEPLPESSCERLCQTAGENCHSSGDGLFEMSTSFEFGFYSLDPVIAGLHIIITMSSTCNCRTTVQNYLSRSKQQIGGLIH